MACCEVKSLVGDTDGVATLARKEVVQLPSVPRQLLCAHISC